MPEHVHGYVAHGLEPVREAFAATLAGGGGSFAAHAADGPLVELWGGIADPGAGRAWQEDTLQLVFSGTKGLAAACLALLADRGELALDAPVARYWPAFGQAGKGAITVAEALSHRAGLAGIVAAVSQSDVLDPDAMAALVAAQAPFWPPEGRLAYHALTYGWICHGLVRAITGETVGSLFRGAFGDPLGLDLWIGLPAALEPRVSQIVRDGWAIGDPPRHVEYGRTVFGPDLFGETLPWNTPAWHRAEIPAGNAIGTAPALARFYACLANGGRADGRQLVSAQAIDVARRSLSEGFDAIYDAPLAFGAGFELQHPDAPRFGPDPDAFGHSGAGGSLHAAWPARRIGISYCTNVMRPEQSDDRGRSILRALDACLEDST
ncbi:MAG TPA: serine hydrolase domain-containing protein [Gaiellales bacterium]